MKLKLPVGMVIENPGGGTSTIMRYSETNVYYKRANSAITVSLEALYNAYMKFKGMRVSSKDLRNYAPHTFDSKHSGHSYNCTFLFSILKLLGVIDTILGEGKAHHPFYVVIPIS
jgi:hypothetical protein